MIREMASEAFMPLAYGGGIGSVNQAEIAFKCGLEKVVINHSIQNESTLITECANHFGSQSIVASIDYKKNIFK